MAQVCWDTPKWYTSLISWDGGSKTQRICINFMLQHGYVNYYLETLKPYTLFQKQASNRFEDAIQDRNEVLTFMHHTHIYQCKSSIEVCTNTKMLIWKGHMLRTHQMELIYRITRKNTTNRRRFPK